MKQLKLTLIFLGMVSLLSSPVWAGVQGQCVNCHTMHNSQNGVDVVPDAQGPQPHLTNDTCVGCHTGTNGGTGWGSSNGDTPFVYSTSEPTGTMLAGGNFFWVVTDDAKGHNVAGICAAVDGALGTAPGSAGTGGGGCGGCHDSLYTPQTAIAGLGSGCEGCHLKLAHHAPAATAGTVTDEDNGFFRFLASHIGGDPSTTIGVEGIEDDDWQYTNAANDHNEYIGKVLTDYSSPPATPLTTLGQSMSAYCCGCHGNFHIQKDGSTANANWIRHPSDAVIPNSGEYASYTVYDPIVPVARPDLSGYTGPTGTVAPDTDLVMCLSCHRAHGSPYDDMLRWDYTQMVAGGGGGNDENGCFKCHSLKD